jgi:hypothetical protein
MTTRCEAGTQSHGSAEGKRMIAESKPTLAVCFLAAQQEVLLEELQYRVERNLISFK